MRNSMKYTWVLFSLFFFTAPIHGANEDETDIHLATISTDYVSKTYDLILTLNHRKLISAIKTKSSNKQHPKTYPVSVLSEPITLVKAVGVTIVSLRCLNFATSKGCDIQIEYPSNITVGSFKIFQAKLEFRDQKWQLTHNGAPFTKMHLISRKVLGLLIGVKRIQVF